MPPHRPQTSARMELASLPPSPGPTGKPPRGCGRGRGRGGQGGLTVSASAGQEQRSAAGRGSR